MNLPKFEVFIGAGGLWYWHLKAKNGEIIAVGEGYTRRTSAIRGIERFRVLAADAPIDDGRVLH